MGILDTRSNLRSRRAAIIGGAGGIGKAITMALVEAEVDVAFCDIDEAAVRTSKAENRSLTEQRCRRGCRCPRCGATSPILFGYAGGIRAYRHRRQRGRRRAHATVHGQVARIL